MPVLQHAAGAQPQIEVLVGTLGCGLVGAKDDLRLVVRIAVEGDAFARLHVGVIALAEAPQRLLGFDDRPAQPAGLVIHLEIRQVVAVTASELRVFLEQTLLHVEAERSAFGVLESLLRLCRGELVDHAIAVENVEQRLAAKLRLLGDQLLRPHLLDLEVLGELHRLPQVRTASPGAFTCWCQNCVRRSALP